MALRWYVALTLAHFSGLKHYLAETPYFSLVIFRLSRPDNLLLGVAGKTKGDCGGEGGCRRARVRETDIKKNVGNPELLLRSLLVIIRHLHWYAGLDWSFRRRESFTWSRDLPAFSLVPLFKALTGVAITRDHALLQQ